MELFGRIKAPQTGERAVLVHVDFDREQDREGLSEFKELVHSAGAFFETLITASRHTPDAKYFVGKGKVEEIMAAVEVEEAEVVIVNHALSPSQERNLSNKVGCRVVDRVGLILDIFAQRARTHEGKLQVELAQLKHMSTRLVKGWTHLERQKGGIGMRGPGETQLESDKRMIGEKIKQLNKRLEKVRKQRELGRRGRQRSDIPTVAIVGYTNAGKSTLFNRLTDAAVYAEDRLFATLDSTLRRVEIPGAGPCILADTVGFIRHIPHDLVAAFRSTLEEAREADLLIHLVDSSDEMKEQKIDEVFEVLEEIGADEVPQILVMNKIDRLIGRAPGVEIEQPHSVDKSWVSAQSGAGMDELMQLISEQFKGRFVQVKASFSAGEGRLRSELFKLGKVMNEAYTDEGDVELTMELSAGEYEQLLNNKQVVVQELG